MMKNESSRRAAEDSLAREISARGAQGVAMYTLLPGGKLEDEAAARQALEKAGVVGAVVMRPVGVEKEVSSTPMTTYADPMHRGYWGGYYGHGWGSSWGMTTGGEIRTDTIVVVETLVYSLKQNKLVWGGQSRTTNPKNVDQLVKKLATSAAQELAKQGLISEAPPAG
jgi:8-oxo-dGTP pyrophosphatase MutT (NUDIX family)